MQQLQWANVLRGIAVLLMIPANFASLWALHPMWYRLPGSYAAPTFIMLSAGMVMLQANRHNFIYYLQRGVIIIGIAALIDVICWHILPFFWADVLNLIGIALPTVYLLHNCSSRMLICLALLFGLATPFLQAIVGYHFDALAVSVNHLLWPGFFRVLQSWFIDGWFPIFPWLGCALLGCVLFKKLSTYPNYQLPFIYLIYGILLATIGFILLFLPTSLFSNFSNSGILPDRMGYADIFYPPTVAYMISAIGVVLVLVWTSQKIVSHKISQYIMVFGKHSMLAYVLHYLFISGFLYIFPYFKIQIPIANNILYFMMLAFVVSSVYVTIQKVRRNAWLKQNNSLILHVLFGVGVNKSSCENSKIPIDSVMSS